MGIYISISPPHSWGCQIPAYPPLPTPVPVVLKRVEWFWMTSGVHCAVKDSKSRTQESSGTHIGVAVFVTVLATAALLLVSNCVLHLRVFDLYWKSIICIAGVRGIGGLVNGKCIDQTKLLYIEPG